MVKPRDTTHHLGGIGRLNTSRTNVDPFGASKEPVEEADQQLDTVVEIKDALDETPGRLLHLQADGWA